MTSISREWNDIQVNVRGFPRALQFARFLYLRIDDARDGRALLDYLVERLGQLTSIEGLDPEEMEGMDGVYWNIAFTHRGLKNLGLSLDVLDTFPPEFKQGMEYRAEDNGDTDTSAPLHWDNYWIGRGIDVWIGLYHPDDNQKLIDEANEIAQEITVSGIAVTIEGEQEAGRIYANGGDPEVWIDDMNTQPAPYGDGDIVLEHFGFNDSVTAPAIEGIWDNEVPNADPSRVPGNGKYENSTWLPLAPGEFVLGHVDEVDEIPIAPQPRLLSHNGTFMVLRKLHQHVEVFRSYVQGVAGSVGNGVTADYVAEKMVGRHRDGKSFNTTASINEFIFQGDEQGNRCPLGAHIRRANPRDTLDFETLLVNRHRIARRGFTYGDAVTKDDTAVNVNGAEGQGLIFIGINASIERQFEFIQRQWANFGNDLDQGDDRDPITGNNDGTGDSNMYVPSEVGNDPNNRPAYVCPAIPRFVDTKGGDYFFMPGLSAFQAIREDKFSEPDLVKMNIISDYTTFYRNTRPTAPAIIDPVIKQQWTYRELDENACRCASALRKQGVTAGDRVAYLGKNHPEFFPYLFGAAKLNAIMVPVNWRLTPGELEYIINHSEAKVLVVSDEFLPALEKMTLNVEQMVILGDGKHDQHTTFDDWIADEPNSVLGTPANPDDTCVLLYTSGTTGTPKGVELTQRNIFSMINGLQGMGWTDESVRLICMPLFHIAGCGWAYANVVDGATTVILRDVIPNEILRVIPGHGVTHAMFVPTVLQFLLMQPDIGEVDFSSLKAILYGGSPITKSVLEQSLQVFQCDFYGTYGLTESTGGVTQMDPEDHDPNGNYPERLDSCGRPSFGHEVKIMNLQGNQEQQEGERGQIWIRGPGVMKGYWKDEEGTSRVITEDGWLKSGDIGFLRDGYLFIADRLHDMIITGGENVYPAEVENVLMSHPGIADCAVIAVPHKEWGETVKAIVVKTDESINEEDLISYCKDNLAGYKCPTSVDWAENILRNATGKIDRKLLREPFWKGRDKTYRNLFLFALII